MFDFVFDDPWFLLLLLLIPALWIFSYHSLSGLGPVRRIVALLLRTAILVLLVLAISRMLHQRTSDKMTVMYLLDQSLSIPESVRSKMLEYVAEEVQEHRNSDRMDRAGVIAFGRDAAIEVPPFDDDLATTGNIESLFELEQDATNLEAALKLAQATFPEDSAKRVVIVTDGNENIGDSREIAALLAERGISLWIVPITLSRRGEVAIEKVTIPPDVRKGQMFDARVVVNNMTEPTAEDSGEVVGLLRLKRRTGLGEETPVESRVVLPPGKKVFKLEQLIDDPDFYTYEAEFVADDELDDGMFQNNRASAFTHVQGQGHVLLIEDWENPGEFDFLVKRLQAMNMEVTVQGSDQTFSGLAELQRYDSVILANVPRASGGDAATMTNFSDAQINMMVRNVQQMGSGLVMLGGPIAFGAGGWSNTELEKAMPVDFQIHNAKVVPIGALVMMMHASEMAQGNHWQKVVAEEALKALGPQDYCGIVQFDWNGGDSWLWGRPQGLIKVGGYRKSMLARLGRMTPGDMPQFDPSMKMAATAFANVPDAGVRHMIMISDGDPSPPAGATIAALKKLNVKITTVAVGTHGPPGSTPLQRIATQTGGKYYVVTNANALPRIYQKEARKVARPLVKEKVVQPQIIYPHEMLQGIDGPLPPIKGFVMTTVKENPLVEVSIVSPDPPGQKNSTILASWTYGVGRTVAFTSDAGARWTDGWVTDWDHYDKLFSQMVRWSMRPLGDQGKFTVATDVKDGKVRVIVTALDKEDEFQNFLDISGTAVDPKMQSLDVRLDQTAPGRYVGEFDADAAGSYFVTLIPGPGQAPIRMGVNVPYSSEFNDRETNAALLNTIAEFRPKGGQQGKLLDDSLTYGRYQSLIETDTFLHDLPKAVSSQDVWPLLVLVASCVFLGDVFIRRVTVHFYWVLPMLAAARNELLGKTREPVVDERMARLRSRKERIGTQIDERRAATRFEPQPDADVDVGVLHEGPTAAPPAADTQRTPTAGLAPAGQEEEDSYTARLMKAKQQALKGRDKRS